MKRIIFALLAVLFVVDMSPGTVNALDVPMNYGYVTDLGGMLPEATEAKLEYYLSQLERRDSTQIGILTIPSLKGESPEEFNIRVFDRWKFGQKDKDNGVILLFSKAEKIVRIDVGYGLEEYLTDLKVGRIIDHVIVPRLREGNFEDAIVEGTFEICKVVRGLYTGTGHAIGD